MTWPLVPPDYHHTYLQIPMIIILTTVWYQLSYTLQSEYREAWASCQIRKIAGAHAPGTPGTFSPPPRVSDTDMHHGTCVTHVPWCMQRSLTSGFLWNRRRGKRFRHSRRMHNLQFYVSGKRPMRSIFTDDIEQWMSTWRQFASARTIDDYGVTVPVSRVYLTRQFVIITCAILEWLRVTVMWMTSIHQCRLVTEWEVIFIGTVAFTTYQTCSLEYAAMTAKYVPIWHIGESVPCPHQGTGTSRSDHSPMVP